MGLGIIFILYVKSRFQHFCPDCIFKLGNSGAGNSGNKAGTEFFEGGFEFLPDCRMGQIRFVEDVNYWLVEGINLPKDFVDHFYFMKEFGVADVYNM